MENYGNFAFGKPVKKVEQKDKSPKKVFVLGVYASAVHARWESPDGHQSIKALAIASEPEIFWRGDNADEIISSIEIPIEAGKLKPADQMYNGPSGRVLDETILQPLGFQRENAWLCDLIPFSLKNERQEKALRKLNPTLQRFNLQEDTRIKASTKKIDSQRIDEILNEVKLSKAELIITLGNEPIKHFINTFDKSFTTLSHELYGQILSIQINEIKYKLLPLVHPRHIEGMSGSSPVWRVTHRKWLQNL